MKGMLYVRNDFERFLETFDSPNSVKVARSFEKICEYDWSNCTPIMIETAILSLKPNSPKAITTMSYILSKYAKHIGNSDMYEMVRDIDRNTIWELAKPDSSRKFISHAQFKQIYNDIEKYEEYNSLYMQSLFRSLYEGIYSDDMSVVKNLKASDVQTDYVTLRPDEEKPYDVPISERLAGDLTKLGAIDTWERRNRYGICKIKTTGLNKDTCFKVENRKGSSAYAYRFSYYRMLRNVSKEYVGYGLSPLHLYISGIMHRICAELKGNNIDIEEAFSDNNRDRKISCIISDELKRSAYDIEVRNFREIVKGRIDEFLE